MAYLRESSSARDFDEMAVRVVLLGKTGSGKSSLGNTLLGTDAFHVARGMCSGTDKCQFADTQRLGVSLQVTDTPGVCDTHRTEVEVLQEVGKSLALAAPGPHVILMVLRCDRRFTQEEYDAYLILKQLFGDGICDHMIIVFAGIDSFGNTGDERDAGLRSEVEAAPQLLQHVLQDANYRYCGLDNSAPREHREQLAHMLMARIQSLISANEGHYFSNELFDDVNKHVQSFTMGRMHESDVSYDDALRATRTDIVEERTSPGFFRKLVDIVGNKILPVLKKTFGDAVMFGKTAVSTYCSLM